MTDIGLLVRSANPVPDESQQLTDDELSAVLLLAQQRSTDMDAKELTRAVEKEPRNKRSGWYAAAAAFALVVLVIGSVVLLNRGTDPEIPPATTPPTTQSAPSTTDPNTTITEAPGVSAADLAVLDAYIAAVASGDEAAIRDVLIPGLVRTSEQTGLQADLDKMILEAQVRQARETITELENCRPSGDRIQCSMVVDGPVERALYPFQLRDNYWFTISGGQIVGMHAKCAVCTPGGQVEAEVRAWVATFDPDAAAAMADIPDYAFSVEGGLAWLKYAPIWRQASTDGSLDAIAFVEALVAEINAGDREAVDATLASVTELTRPSGGWDATPLAPYVQFWIELDSTVEILGCRKSDDGTTRCNIERYSDGEPWAPLAWTGQFVVSMNEDFVEILNLMGFDGDPWKVAGEAFRFWVRENRNDELWLIYNNDDPVERAEAQARLFAEYQEQTG